MLYELVCQRNRSTILLAHFSKVLFYCIQMYFSTSFAIFSDFFSKVPTFQRIFRDAVEDRFDPFRSIFRRCSKRRRLIPSSCPLRPVKICSCLCSFPAYWPSGAASRTILRSLSIVTTFYSIVFRNSWPVLNNWISDCLSEHGRLVKQFWFCRSFGY